MIACYIWGIYKEGAKWVNLETQFWSTTGREITRRMHLIQIQNWEETGQRLTKIRQCFPSTCRMLWGAQGRHWTWSSPAWSLSSSSSSSSPSSSPSSPAWWTCSSRGSRWRPTLGHGGVEATPNQAHDPSLRCWWPILHSPPPNRPPCPQLDPTGQSQSHQQQGFCIKWSLLQHHLLSKTF